MNRRDAALIAHLDAVESRWLQQLTTYHFEVMAELRAIREDIAGLKVDLATHGHGEE